MCFGVGRALYFLHEIIAGRLDQAVHPLEVPQHERVHGLPVLEPLVVVPANQVLNGVH